MDVYGTQSRGPQKHSTDIQLFMIHIDYDKNSSEEEKEDIPTSTEIPSVSGIASTILSSPIQMTTDATTIVNNNMITTATEVLSTGSDENDDDDCSWNTEIAEARAPLGKFRELLIPDRPNDNSERSRKDWLKDIKYCLQHRYVYCHQCKQWVTKAQYKSRNIQGDHWICVYIKRQKDENSPIDSKIFWCKKMYT